MLSLLTPISVTTLHVNMWVSLHDTTFFFRFFSLSLLFKINDLNKSLFHFLKLPNITGVMMYLSVPGVWTGAKLEADAGYVALAGSVTLTISVGTCVHSSPTCFSYSLSACLETSVHGTVTT